MIRSSAHSQWIAQCQHPNAEDLFEISSEFMSVWISVWLTAWMISFPAVLFAAPLVRRLTQRLVGHDE